MPNFDCHLIVLYNDELIRVLITCGCGLDLHTDPCLLILPFNEMRFH